MKTYVFTLILLCSLNALADDLVVTPTGSLNPSQASHELESLCKQQSELLFSDNEKTDLTARGHAALAETRVIRGLTRDQLLELGTCIKRAKPAWHIERNEVVQTADTEHSALFSQQWGLKNVGQSQSIQTSDLTSQLLPARENEDVDQDTTLNELKLPRTKVRVAILDTGIDLTHPDLVQNLIPKTQGECDAVVKFQACLNKAQVDLSAAKTAAAKAAAEAESDQCVKVQGSVDSDGNGYPMDCQGYDFTHEASVAPNPNDSVGHGTHVAGIIAAIGDLKGIEGIASHVVELLPIKVIANNVGSPVTPTSARPIPSPTDKAVTAPRGLADVIARGLLYAIRNHAQVVNLSLTWPVQADSPLIREMIEIADEQGILIVAAAGNDATDYVAPPCNQGSVICVAAEAPDGTLTGFSNFGPFADIAAPGINILSTWPTAQRPTRFTDFSGYDFKDGTSMSAPFVAGAAALLLNQGMNPREVRARLLSGSRDLGTLPIQFGKLDLKGAMSVQPHPVFVLDQKLPAMAQLAAGVQEGSEISFQYEIKNIWSEAPSVQVESQILNLDGTPTSAVELVTAAQAVNTVWPKDAVIPVKFTVKIKDLKALETSYTLAMVLSVPGQKPQRVLGRLEIGRTLDSALSDVPSDLLTGGSIDPSEVWVTVQEIDQSIAEHPSYLLMKRTADFHIQLRRLDPEVSALSGLVEYRVKNPVVSSLAIGQQPVGVFKLPAPSSQLNSWVAIWQSQQGFLFTVLDPALNVVTQWTYDNSSAPLGTHFIWAWYQDGYYPHWIGVGSVPPLECPAPTAWSAIDPAVNDPNYTDPCAVKDLRLYVSSPQGLHSVAAPVGYSWLYLVGGTFGSDPATSTLSALLGKSTNDPLTSAIATVQNGIAQLPRAALQNQSSSQGLLLDGSQKTTVLDLSQSPVSSLNLALSTDSVMGAQKTAVIGLDGSLLLEQKNQLPSGGQAVTQMVGAYLGGAIPGTFGLTASRIGFFPNDSAAAPVSRDLRRFSFLPSFYFDSEFFPTYVKSGKKLWPAVFTPSGVLSSYLEVVRVAPLSGGHSGSSYRLSRPALFHYSLSAGCQTLDSPPGQVIVQCRDRVFHLPLNLD